jgi:hypothetical protein
MVFQDMSWKDLQVFFKTKEKAENIVKRVKWADKLEEIRYFIKEKDLINDNDSNEKQYENQENEIDVQNNKNKSHNTQKTDANIEVINEQPNEPQENKPAYRFTKEMVRLALYRNGGSNAQKNWRKLFRLVSSAVLDDRINEIMESDWV